MWFCRHHFVIYPNNLIMSELSDYIYSCTFYSMLYSIMLNGPLTLNCSPHSALICSKSVLRTEWCLLTYTLITCVISRNISIASGWQMLSHVDSWKRTQAPYKGVVGSASVTSTWLYFSWHTRAEMMCRALLQHPISQTVPGSHRLPCQHPRSSCWIMQSRVCSFSPTLSFRLCARSGNIKRTAMPSTC